MPKSKVRKKTDYTINPASRTPVKVKAGPSGIAYQALMFGFMLAGLVWLLVFYLAASNDSRSVAQPGGWLHWMFNLGQWNLLIGFGLGVIGLLMTMGWR
ncbi:MULTISPECIES: cell division protein CrgA [unclassified Gordonia (in: high G+C Gram-positive bacteria)]|uniref:cell division protein CrgA n=1 Tax=unclassified Gordonia (in: high G+C Gram-positive bacteria) TaxID=2657482 RepID=UPI001FFF806C|nr:MULTISPECIES: cell division protein CrgA [unclassified Gordonia (in: high G+C Gram-positive bacteria)]UQE75095.1 cell division protein CrgA [Gordonia sp. PP30]